MFGILDHKLRKYFSIVYRFLLAFYAIIILTSQDNVLPIPVYAAGLVVYFVLFSELHRKHDLPLMRLILDYAMINLVLYGKSIQTYENYFFVLLPILNSPNNSSEKASENILVKRVYIYPFAILTVVLLSSRNITPKIFLPVLTAVCLDQFIRFRTLIEGVSIGIFTALEDFYLNSRSRRQLFELFLNILFNLKSPTIARSIDISSLSAFIRKENDLSIVGSSTFFLDYSLVEPDQFFKTIGKQAKTTVYGHPIIINGVIEKNTIYKRVKADGRIYYFLVVFSRSSNILIKSLFDVMILEPVLKHLAIALEIEYNEGKKRGGFINGIKKKQEYVLKATEVMHFVKNSLSPIKHVITLNRMIAAPEFSHLKEYLEAKRDEQVPLASSEIQNIVTRANYILKKSRNPFVVSAVSNHTLQDFFIETRKKWAETFSHKDIQHHFKTQALDSVKVSYSSEYMDIIYTNIFSNISKYNGGKVFFSIIENDEQIIVRFGNNLSPTTSINEIKKLIIEYNSEQKWEINKRKTHGMAHVKLYLNQMKIQNEIMLDEDNNYIFEFKLNKL